MLLHNQGVEKESGKFDNPDYGANQNQPAFHSYETTSSQSPKDCPRYRRRKRKLLYSSLVFLCFFTVAIFQVSSVKKVK